MSQNPLNLLLRFLLELFALGAMAYWGWTQHSGVLRVVLALGLPVLAAAVWGVFRVSGYPKDAPVEAPGVVRLLIEFVYSGVAAAEQPTASADELERRFRAKPDLYFPLDVIQAANVRFPSLPWLHIDTGATPRAAMLAQVDAFPGLGRV